MSCSNKDTDFFPLFCIHFLFLLVLAKTLNTILNTNAEDGHLCLISIELLLGSSHLI